MFFLKLPRKYNFYYAMSLFSRNFIVKLMVNLGASGYQGKTI